jgi:hypothetical protein
MAKKIPSNVEFRATLSETFDRAAARVRAIDRRITRLQGEIDGLLVERSDLVATANDAKLPDADANGQR